MKIDIKQLLGLIVIAMLLSACDKKGGGSDAIQHPHAHGEAGHTAHENNNVHLSPAQFEAMEMKVDTLRLRNLSSAVQANGLLEVPPQNEAIVTAIMGANVASIQVIEGEDVRSGQVLAYLSHPNLTQLQSDYLESHSKLQFLEQDFQRQKKLYEEEVGSGKAFQQTEARYTTALGMAKSLKLQLRQLGMNPERIQKGDFYERVPITSPIDGSIVSVEVKTGQYVQPERTLFEIVNTDHIHADLMVFEKDVHKVKKGQKVVFNVETAPENELMATIYSVSKKFEQGPKAVYVHAEITNKAGKLIPGMYIKGEILTDSAETYALPEEAITREGDKHIAFVAEREMQGEKESWMFTPIEVKPGVAYNGWVAVKFLQEMPDNARFAMNNAYYLIAEMKKGEGGHDH